MSDLRNEPVPGTNAPTVSPATGLSAGAMLRAAREAQGLHLETLANIVKVPARKLDALEKGHIDELHDAAFARALAQTMCRALKIDPKPVLAQLPAGRQHAIERVADGLNTPFRERALREESPWRGLLGKPFVWAAAALVVASAVIFVLPVRLEMPSWLAGWATWFSTTPDTRPVTEPAAAPTPDAVASAGLATLSDAPVPAASVPDVVVDTVHSTPSEPVAAAPVSEAVLVLHASAESWIEVVDRNGQPLLARTLAAGDSVGIDGALPMRVKIGNAAATSMNFRGQSVDLAAVTRDNVARIDLK